MNRLLPLRIVTFVLALAPLAACESQSKLIGTWTLKEFIDAPGAPAIPPPGRTRPTVTFDPVDKDGEGRISGVGAVNRFSGKYQASSEQLAVGSLSTTRLAGPPELMNLERVYLGVFQGPLTWKVKKDELTLTGLESGMVLERSKEAEKKLDEGKNEMPAAGPESRASPTPPPTKQTSPSAPAKPAPAAPAASGGQAIPR